MPRSLETVHSYSDCIKVVTDGSDVGLAEKRVLYGGIMLYHERADTPREDLSGPCGAFCDYEVEMESIRMVIEGIGTRVDALLVLQAIDGLWEWPWRLTRTLLATSDLISRHGVKVTIQCILDYAGSVKTR